MAATGVEDPPQEAGSPAPPPFVTAIGMSRRRVSVFGNPAATFIDSVATLLWARARQGRGPAGIPRFPFPTPAVKDSPIGIRDRVQLK